MKSIMIYIYEVQIGGRVMNDELEVIDDTVDEILHTDDGVVKRVIKRIKKMPKKHLIIGVIAIVVLLMITVSTIHKISGGGKGETAFEIMRVERRDIIRTVEGSSTVEANDSYNVTALATGEIMSDTFNEGDTVTKDQVLYTIDSKVAQNKVDMARNSLEKAQRAFSDAVKKKNDTVAKNKISKESQENSIKKALDNVESAKRNYTTASNSVNRLTVVADISGVVSEVLVNEGDSVNDGTKLAKVYDDSRLKLEIPFNDADAAEIAAGYSAEVSLASTGDTLEGYVESVASSTTALDSHAIVRYVTIVVNNPGGLKAGAKASAVVGDVACTTLAELKNYDEGAITARTSGRIEDLWLSENDSITVGQAVGFLSSESAQNTLASSKESLAASQRDLDDAYGKLEQLVIDSDTYSLDSSIRNAAIELDNARISLEEAQENLDDYNITAPIDGTIITKNKKAGDKLEQNQSSSAEPMAIIYDMSVLKIQLTVDESEIHDVAVGQEVSVTADAVEGDFKGVVSKVGINGTSENGVTVYPVDVEISEYGDLLPGMNVDCVINIESAKNVLAVPVQAIQRGNKVFVKGDKTDDNDKAPEGYHSVDVQTGATDSEFIEIKNGLNEGDELCSTNIPTGVEAQGNAEQAMPGGMGGGFHGGMSGSSGGGFHGSMGGPPM